MIVVTTPTGSIGSQLVQDLLEAGEPVRLVLRDPSRITAEIAGKAEVIAGSHGDAAVMQRALDGAESLFHVVPPSFTTNDSDAYYLSMTQPAIDAAKAQGVRRIVTVSGVGRGVDVKAGPVSSSFKKDEAFERSGIDYRALWCPGFMENMLRQLVPLRQQGAFYQCGRGDVKMPFVATRDIAAAAAKLLTDRSWTGQGGVGVLGPEDLSLDEMAVILTEVLGKSIRFQAVPDEAYKAQLMSHGASEHFAAGLIEMHQAKDNGLDNTLRRDAENTSTTSFRQWCEEVLKPAYLAS